MSQQLISHNPDLKKLRDEGFEVEIRSNYLVVTNIPYVNSKKEIKYGVLVSELSLAGDGTIAPSTHVAYFAGEYPCDRNGVEIGQIRHQTQDTRIDETLTVNHSFSSKPTAGYKDYYEKMTTYIAIISSPAESIDTKVTAKTFPVLETQANESPFKYIDTASSRAEINIVTKKLERGKIAIVGLGGTGSYILDLVAKTPVREIHLFDGDVFSQHNAFRCPGAPSIEELCNKPQKVKYLKELYSKMHRGIVSHDYFISQSTVDELNAFDFTFLCLDAGEIKKLIVDKYLEWGKPFIDVGMGIQLQDESLLGILRITTSTNLKREHVKGKNRITFSESTDNEYSKNIQVADLNALNAALAVVKWKKLYGFYLDLEKEYYSTYTIDGNMLTNEDRYEENNTNKS
jgi:tRNA A37 threonylcarbamoyladenosine dehydratase